ncbi:RDD family protein [Mobilicoccus massiliensis]|uniref:RDD family protein n=1 Tax=Mobilicoccus massiliensis TaxID=1522310 RepID=UPI00069452B0|nr:RDD family protein [Mobilicoccus massiliensis]
MRTAQRSDDVTGEAVVVALPVAGPPIRMLSGLIDVVVIVLVSIVLQFAVFRLLGMLGKTGAGADEAVIAAIIIVLQVAVFVGLPVACERRWGRTVGKVVTGLRTVRDDGAPADLRRLVTRHLVGVVEVWGSMGSIALIALLASSPTRRLGDMAAGTYVARDRLRLELPPAPPMPPPLEPWARSADLGRLPDDLAALVRSSLAQRAQFTDEASRRLDASLADRVLAHVSPPPPAGTPPHEILQAVLAERRRREGVRLTRQRRRRERLFPAPGAAASASARHG